MSIASFGQFKKSTSKSIFQSLQYDRIIGVIIETNLDSLINYRNRDTDQKGSFTYVNDRGRLFSYDIGVRPRGKFRRKICDFPMIKINFKKKDLKKNKYAKFDDYKIVTHCINSFDASYESVAREYLAYKLYNILSPQSYQVQFLYITYIDSKKVIPSFEHFGFIIEDTAELSNRLSAEVRKEIDGLLMDSINVEQHNFVALFQYMIGNTDWVAYPIARNVKIIKLEKEQQYRLVPFDFDFSGLVAAPYAVPTGRLNQRSIRQRIFQGEQYDTESLDTSITYFLSKKKKLLKYVKRFTLLSKESRKDILEFLEPFFIDLENRTLVTIKK